MTRQLTFYDHQREFAGNTYIYPVLSRRSQGVSLGINLNVNNACNWRCVYCQVPGLIRDKPVAIDIARLELELDHFLQRIVHGDFLAKYAPEDLRRLNDISISGNGEPTLSKDFLAVVHIIIRLRQKYHLEQVKLVLITNGSEIKRSDVQQALKQMSKYNGEVWFKIDRGRIEDIQRVNQVNLPLSSIENNLRLCSSLCKTYIQSCFFRVDGKEPDSDEIADYVNLVARFNKLIAGVLLYSTARKPMLVEGNNITAVELVFLEKIAQQLANYGIQSRCYQ